MLSRATGAQVSISLMANSGKVHFDGRERGVSRLVDSVAALGYKATPCGGAADGSSEITPAGHLDEAHRWRGQLLGSLLFTLPVFVLSMVIPPAMLAAPAPVAGVLSWRVLLILLCATPVQVGLHGRLHGRCD